MAVSTPSATPMKMASTTEMDTRRRLAPAEESSIVLMLAPSRVVPRSQASTRHLLAPPSQVR